MHFDLLPTPVPSKADLARTKLLEAGLKCFAEKGLDGVTIREIAQEAELNSASITYYFGSKEGLYRSVLDAVMRFFQIQLQTALLEKSPQADEEHDPIQAKALLEHIMHTMALSILQDGKTAYFAMLMVREQTQPSADFDPLYKGTIEPMHRMFATLLATMTGDAAESPRTVLRAHALIGQLQVFVMARETLLRRMGWPDYGADRAEKVASVLVENFDLLLAGLHAQGASNHNGGLSS